MAKRMVLGLALGTVILGLAAQACTLGSDTYITEKSEISTKDAGTSTTATTTSATTSATCGTDDFDTVDVSKLTACGNGKGHCVDKTKVGIGNLDACADASTVCLPDEFIKAAGQKLKSCKSLIGDGACFAIDPMTKIAAMGGSALSQDVCDAGEKCVPCVDPQHGNAPTGFCDPTGVHKNACSAGAAAAATTDSAAASCCTTGGKSNGTCIASTAVPADEQDMVSQDTCGANNLCVPTAFVQNKPSHCSGGVFGNGVCMDKCFSNAMAIAGGIGFLDQDACGSTELCIPCLFVSGKGVPGCQ